MSELIARFQSDPVLMISGAIGIVILLFVVLVVVVASMRVKTYKDRYVDVKVDNEAKEKRIAVLEEEMKVLLIKNTQNEQELQQFDDTKKRLAQAVELLEKTQKEFASLQTLQGQTQTQLDQLREQYEALKDAYGALNERMENLNEENSKLRVNNARLLMKLETEERFISQIQQRKKQRINNKGENE